MRVLLRWNRGRRVDFGAVVTLPLILLPWLLSHSDAAAFLLIPPSGPTATHSAVQWILHVAEGVRFPFFIMGFRKGLRFHFVW